MRLMSDRWRTIIKAHSHNASDCQLTGTHTHWDTLLCLLIRWLKCCCCFVDRSDLTDIVYFNAVKQPHYITSKLCYLTPIKPIMPLNDRWWYYLSWFISNVDKWQNNTDKRKTPQGKEGCLAPAINKTCQCLRIWASVDLLFGSTDSLARFPARGEGRKEGGRERVRGGEMSEPRDGLRDLSVLWSDDWGRKRQSYFLQDL